MAAKRCCRLLHYRGGGSAWRAGSVSVCSKSLWRHVFNVPIYRLIAIKPLGDRSPSLRRLSFPARWNVPPQASETDPTYACARPIQRIQHRRPRQSQRTVVIMAETTRNPMLLQRTADVVARIDDDPSAIVFDTFQLRWTVLHLAFRLAVGVAAAALDLVDGRTVEFLAIKTIRYRDLLEFVLGQ